MHNNPASCEAGPPLESQYFVKTIGRILHSNNPVAIVSTQQSVSAPTINTSLG